MSRSQETMTPKEEVLRLAEESGFCAGLDGNGISCIWAVNQCIVEDNCNANIAEEITKLIELAKEQERERIINILKGCDESWQAINPLLHEAIRKSVWKETP